MAILEQVHHPQSHRLDARQVALLYGVSLKQLSVWLRSSYNTLKKTPDARTAQAQLAQLVNAWQMLITVFASEQHVRRWLYHPLPGLRGKTAMWLLEAEGVNAFEGLAEGIVAGDYD